MITMIELGGKMRPIEFSTKVAYDFERLTGKVIWPKLTNLSGTLPVGAAEGSDAVDIGRAVAQMSVVRFVDITFSALAYAHAVQRMPVDFTQRDVAGWLLDNNFTPAWPVANLIIDSCRKPNRAKHRNLQKKAGSGGIDWNEWRRAAADAGMSEDEFWQTTPRYLFERCRAANEEKLRARYRTYAVLKALGVGMDINKPSAMYRFEWEEPEPTAAEMWQKHRPVCFGKF